MGENVVSLVDAPEIVCAGIRQRTVMERAREECSELWNTRFGPRMDEFPHDSLHAGECFGVVRLHGGGILDYWAADSLASGAPVPAGMEKVVIPAGRYAKFAVPDLDTLIARYRGIFTHWLPENRDLEFDDGRPGYELYDRELLRSGALFLLFPVRDADGESDDA